MIWYIDQYCTRFSATSLYQTNQAKLIGFGSKVIVHLCGEYKRQVTKARDSNRARFEKNNEMKLR